MLVHLQPVGDRGMYYMNVLDQRTDPGYGQGGGFRPDNSLPGGGGRPDNTLPGMGGRPDQGLPGHGHPDQGLPGSGARPDQGLPGQGQGRPGIPSNELPDHPPPQVAQGMTLVLIRHEGKWAYATIAPGSPPPKPLPNPPEHVGGRPPGCGGGEHPSGQPVPPTAQPQRR